MQRSRLARAALLATVLLLGASAFIRIVTAPPEYDVGGHPLQLLLAAFMVVPIVFARRAPTPMALLVALAVGIDFTLGGGAAEAWFAIVLAVYALGAHAPLRRSAPGLIGIAALILAFDVPRLAAGTPPEDVLPAWFVLAGVWGLGRWVRQRHRVVDRLAEEAAALEHDREEAARAAVAYERARIARELHDLVAHSMAVIVLQAQAADRVLDADTPSVRRALRAIESTGREGLAELRRMLDVLLQDEEDDPLGPRPGLAQVDELACRLREAGLPTAVTIHGTSRPLPPGVDLSAYRIVQEALTNTLRHAGQARASVDLTYRPDAVELSVTDDGDADAPETVGSGRGIIGMRERANLFGGSLDAGPLPGKGYRVHAVLPTEAP